jgi:hypothetical protein
MGTLVPAKYPMLPVVATLPSPLAPLPGVPGGCGESRSEENDRSVIGDRGIPGVYLAEELVKELGGPGLPNGDP